MITFDVHGSCVHSNPVQTAFYLGHLDVHWYAITYLLGFLIAIIIGCIKMHYYYKVSYEPFFWYAIMAIPGAILGARCWSYIIGDAKFTTPNPWDAFLQFFGGDGAGGIAGLAILGGVILDVIIALIWFPLILKRAKYSVRVINEQGIETLKRTSSWIYADAIVPLIVLGQAVGRWGNFTNHEVFGDLTTANNLDFLVYMIPGVFDNMYIIPQQATYVNLPELANFYQPFFLYESFGDIMLWALLYFVIERIRWIKRGSLACGYFIGYGIIRSGMELNRYGFDFIDERDIPYGSNGYSLMKFGYDKDYVTACLFIIFGVIGFVFVNLYVYKLRTYKMWSFLLQKVSYPFAMSFYKLKQIQLLNQKKNLQLNKNQRISLSALNTKLEETDKNIKRIKLYLSSLKAYDRTKDLKYYYADFDYRNN